MLYEKQEEKNRLEAENQNLKTEIKNLNDKNYFEISEVNKDLRI